MASKEFKASQAVPSPIDISTHADSTILHKGPSKFGGREGEVALTLDFFPRPKIRFEFAPTTPFGFLDHYKDSPWDLTELILLGTTPKQLGVIPFRAGARVSGSVIGKSIDSVSAKIRMLVINGPTMHGTPVDFGRIYTHGRTKAKLANCSITLDQIPAELGEVKSIFAYQFTHILELVPDQPGQQINDVLDTIFRTLSFIRGRWVGLVGPWCYDDRDQLIDMAYRITKVSSHGDAETWYHEEIKDVFADLASKIHATRSNDGIYQAMLTAMHWSVESSLCAGGMEGSLILQQSALECLAWHEIVKTREICSKDGFKKLSAEDKIRWLLSLWNIDSAIPAHFESLTKLAKEKNYKNTVTALTEIRNILVHAEPDKSVALFARQDSSGEIRELRRLITSILHQAILASLGYKGEVMYRHKDARMAIEAIGPVPWSNT